MSNLCVICYTSRRDKQQQCAPCGDCGRLGAGFSKVIRQDQINQISSKQKISQFLIPIIWIWIL